MAYFITDKCINCKDCETNCPVECISADEINGKEIRVIDPDMCIECGTCASVCPVEDAIILEED